MPENILVVEYEPRYTDRVRQALAGQPFVPSFAKDGEEAMKVLGGDAPTLIVLSSVVPKVSTSELIRAIRGSAHLAATPILLTVSGYNGKSPKADAVRMGASDILPKPYSESEFLGKVQQMLGVRGDAASARQWTPELDPEFTVRPTPVPSSAGGFTSNEIFGELLEDDRAPSTGVRKAMKPSDDLDKMLADTLSGVRPQPKKKDPAPAAAPTPVPPAMKPMDPAGAKPRTQNADFDKMLNDTLSGLEKSARPRPAAPPVAPAPAPAPPVAAAPAPAAAPAARSRYDTGKIPVYVEKTPVSQPIIPMAPVPPPAPLTAPFEDDEPSDGTKFGQYVMLDKIATGGMAEVWKARMRGVEGFQKIVAIKKILPHLSDNQDFIEMFVDEAKLAAQLNHNNIIHIYDLGKIQSSYYIAMEYIDGHDLKTILRRGEERDQPMQVELALFIASKVAAALDYAHRKHDFEGKDLGLVHRDVSPQNVLISQEGDIKLCDFGIAKAASKASHTQAGALKGKLQYMSPEQAWGKHIDRRSDVFALAAVLFEMLTGRKLFTGDNELSILEQVREARVAAPSSINDEVTPEIDRIVKKALEKDPDKRYQSAGEMAKDLDAVLYSFRPTPTSADLAIYMHRIWSEDAFPAAMPQHHHDDHEPVHDPGELRPIVKPAAAAAATVPTAAPMTAVPMVDPGVAPAAMSDAPEKKAPIVPIAIAAIVVLAIIGGFFALRSKGTATAAPATTASVAPAPNAATTSTAPLTASVAPGTQTSAPAGATQTAIDPAQVNAEVQKRLAQEKLRLEQQARAQQTTTQAIAQTASAQPARPVPAPVTATQAAAPQPVAEARPVPAPQPVAPQPVAEARPAPQPAADAAPRVREGDLVAAGTDGLTPPRMTSRAALAYPFMARQQRVEGSVLLSVLVSETGKVLDVRVIRGINRAVGLNEAAETTVRRSSFAPGNKDGVPVKVWIPVTIDFKL
jgi:TonB family protein